MSFLAEVAEALTVPAEGLTLDGYRRLVYGMDCPGCHKSMHQQVVAWKDESGWPVTGKQGRFRLMVSCRRPGCGRLSSLQDLGLRIRGDWDAVPWAEGAAFADAVSKKLRW